MILGPLLLLPPLVASSDGSDWDLPEGLEAALWAESPRLHNPTAIDVDPRGRVWVAEAVNYRKWGGRNPGLAREGGDRIVVLEDRDGDGRCDTSTVFVQDPELTAPLGIAVLGQRVFVSSSPSLFVYEDLDGDLVADRREVFLDGFGGFDHDHGLHSVVPGPDGRLWLAVGNAGPHLVTDRDGWTLRSGSLYDGGGPVVADNKPRLVSDDGRVWTGGLVLRVGEDARGLAVVAHNFRNNYEVAVDAFGDFYQSDNDDDGNQSCRVLWCLEGGDHGYFSADGSRYWTADRRPGQSTPRAHWHQDDPGVAPMGTITGAGGPTGVAVYEGELLAPWIGGAVLSADAGAGVVRAHLPRPSGAGFVLEGGPFLAPAAGEEGERARWFRPSDVAVGVDGALFVADWYDPGVGGHRAGDREAYGRLLRIAPRGHRAEPARPDAASVAARVAGLASPAPSVRHAARAALLAVGDGAREEVRSALRAAQGGDDRRLAARALWILAGEPFRDEDAVASGVESPDARLRCAALRAFASGRGAAAPPGWMRARGLDRDPSAAVRREVLLQLREAPLDTALPSLIDLAERFDGADRTYLEAFGLAVAGREEVVYAELAAALGDVPARWDARFEGLAWRLHPEAAVDAWVVRARDDALAPEVRRRAVDALAFTPGSRAPEAVALLADVGGPAVREHARWWLRHRSTNDWRGLDLRPESPLEHADEVFRSDVVRAGTIALDVDVSAAATLWLLADDAGDGNACDWVAWLRPQWRMADGSVRSILDADWLEAEAEWGSVRVDANCVGGPLVVEGRTGERGLGSHATSRIAYRVPPGAERFVCDAGTDVGGTSQGDGRITSVRFAVALEPVPDTGRLARLEARALDAGLGAEERRAAAEELARDPRGALRWIRRAEEGALGADLHGWIAAAIHRNPDYAIRALASERFPRPGEAARALPPVAELAAREGDPRTGRRLLLDRERTQCLTCHRFTSGDTTIGGSVGPDLSRVAEKLDRGELLDAILNPSAAIAFGYDTWTIETRDGELFAGFLLADGEDVVIEDTQGFRHVVDRDEIARRSKQELSTMPEGVALGLSVDELVDLVAVLEAPVAGPPAREPGPPVDLFDGESLTGWRWFSSDAAAPAERVWSARDGVLACAGSPAGYLRTEATWESFELTLEWRFDPARGPGNSGVLLRVAERDEVWPRSIEAQLNHRDAGDLWNIGAFGMEVAPGRTEGRRTRRLQPSSERPLGEWNRYEIRLEGPRLEVRVNGVLQNTADWCEEVPGSIALQSEGAPIEFRNVVLRPL